MYPKNVGNKFIPNNNKNKKRDNIGIYFQYMLQKYFLNFILKIVYNNNISETKISLKYQFT